MSCGAAGGLVSLSMLASLCAAVLLSSRLAARFSEECAACSAHSQADGRLHGRHRTKRRQCMLQQALLPPPATAATRLMVPPTAAAAAPHTGARPAAFRARLCCGGGAWRGAGTVPDGGGAARGHADGVARNAGGAFCVARPFGEHLLWLGALGSQPCIVLSACQDSQAATRGGQVRTPHCTLTCPAPLAVAALLTRLGDCPPSPAAQFDYEGSTPRTLHVEVGTWHSSHGLGDISTCQATTKHSLCCTGARRLAGVLWPLNPRSRHTLCCGLHRCTAC